VCPRGTHQVKPAIVAGPEDQVVIRERGEGCLEHGRREMRTVAVERDDTALWLAEKLERGRQTVR
jgi:hypothetical protein